MKELSANYAENIEFFDKTLRINENFDLVKRKLLVGKDELTLYCIDGFVKGDILQKMMLHFISLEQLTSGDDAAQEFADRHIPYVEIELSNSHEVVLLKVLSGSVAIFGSTFGGKCILIDAKSYPQRSTAEPESDRVMRGSRDGFVETLKHNITLIRRRIRDPNLAVMKKTVGDKSPTDLALLYINGAADPEYVNHVSKMLDNIKTVSLTMGHESLAECLIKNRWYNPFPKIRSTERPDTAAAQLLEGNVIILCDNSPEAMMLPTSIFDFLQEADDYYFPPFTGTYLRILRHLIFWLTLFLTPLWYLLIKNTALLPDWLSFIIPTAAGEIPIVIQLLMAELAIDGLKLASMNTPNILTNSLSVVAGIILGDFAVKIGWLIPEVILYMAFVAIANFTQPSYELGYAFKFMRMLLIVLVGLFNVWGFVGGTLLIITLIATNKTVNGKRSYLYPLIPFDRKALVRLLVRVRKDD
ncbi:MAG: spore germination protein [Clostridiales bacterium]|nr:spore germination protein [Clostridiales bacterium]